MIYRYEDSVGVERDCPFCGRTWMCSYPTEKYEKWENGEPIQKAMIAIPRESREFLISGICPECQEKIFE